MKKYRRFANLIASAAISASIAAVPMSASAAGTLYTPGLTDATDGTNPVSNNVTMIDKYLVMDVNANVPNASFDFSIAPYDSNAAEKAVITPASGSNLAVINGVTAICIAIRLIRAFSDTNLIRVFPPPQPIRRSPMIWQAGSP